MKGLPWPAGSIRAFRQDPLGLFLRLVQAGGDAGRFHYGPFPVVFLASAAGAEAALVTHAAAFDKGPAFHRAFRPIIGRALLNSEGADQRAHRLVMAPAFMPRRVAGYAETMVACAERAQAGWAEGTCLDLAPTLSALTMQIAGAVVFGADLGVETGRLSAALATAVAYAGASARQFVPLPLWWPGARSHRTRAALALLRRWTEARIAARRHDAGGSDDLLGLLLRAQAGGGMTDAAIRDELVMLLLIGHESPANALAWAFALLAAHPPILARVQAEVDAVLGGRPPAAADLPQLPYTLQVLKETLRLYPPAWVISRMAQRPVILAGYPVRRWEIVTIPVYAIHRRPDYYPDPARFDPARWTPEAAAARPRYAYLPFGAGPRVCLAQHFALLEAHLLLAAFVQRVSFTLLPGRPFVPDPTVTLRPRAGCRVVVHRRFAA